MINPRTAVILTGTCLGLALHGEAQAGCEKDTECKGDRICEEGRCVSPVQTSSGAEPGAWSSPEGMPPPPKAPSLCTGDSDCKGHRVCQEGECKDPPVSRSVKEKKKGPAFPTVKARFTKRQLDELRLAGCPLDQTSSRMADRLTVRGFSSSDFVYACREEQSMRASDPQAKGYPRGMLETLAAALALGLDRRQRDELVRYRHGKGLSLSSAYSRVVIGGHVTEVAGWSLSGAGAAALLVGLILIPVAADHVVDDGPGIDLDKEGYGVASAVLGGSGAALLIAGVPALVLGRQRRKTWLAPGTLEKERASQLKARRKSRGQAKAPSITVTPVLGLAGVGVGVAF